MIFQEGRGSRPSGSTYDQHILPLVMHKQIKSNKHQHETSVKPLHKFVSHVGTINMRINRVATVREKVLENKKIARSGKSQGITFSVREI